MMEYFFQMSKGRYKKAKLKKKSPYYTMVANLIETCCYLVIAIRINTLIKM